MRKKKRRRREANTIAGLAKPWDHKKTRTQVSRWPGLESVRNGPRKNVWHPQTSDPISNQLIIKVSIEKFSSLKDFYNMSRQQTLNPTTDTEDERAGPRPTGYGPPPTGSRPTSRPTSRATTSRPSSRPPSGASRSLALDRMLRPQRR